MAAALQMQSTRQHILEYLQRQGRATVKELGNLLGLTSTGIRQHLTVLERDGLVDAREERGRVGRPTLVYSLPEKADALFPKTHDLLHKVAERMAAPYVERIEGRPLPERVRETARIMEEQGCLVDVREADDGEYYIDEFTCPFPKVAQQDRPVSPLHVDFVRVLPGGDPRLTQSLLRGERACCYRVRPAQP